MSESWTLEEMQQEYDWAAWVYIPDEVDLYSLTMGGSPAPFWNKDGSSSPVAEHGSFPDSDNKE